MTHCPCGSGRSLAECCEPILQGQPAPTAEALMRARYTAYTRHDIAFIMRTTEAESRKTSDEAAMRAWAEAADWQDLEILHTEGGQAGDSEGTVEFVARFGLHGAPNHHHEISQFQRIDGQWQFVEGQELHSGPSERLAPLTNPHRDLGRNDPCHCGSGKKFKKCCGA